jgi:hypothetical protein
VAEMDRDFLPDHILKTKRRPLGPPVQRKCRSRLRRLEGAMGYMII